MQNKITCNNLSKMNVNLMKTMIWIEQLSDYFYSKKLAPCKIVILFENEFYHIVFYSYSYILTYSILIIV